MHKLILSVLMFSFFMMMFALQTDEELAMHTLFHAKHALNRATHAAAQQVDLNRLAAGEHAVDPTAARAAAELYLRSNLRLDANNEPLPEAFLRAKVDVLVFEVINGGTMFPHTYTNETYQYEVTVSAPAVVMIIRVDYPRTYNVLGPITWEIKSASEMVY
jgi:hypothetical protein